MLFVMRLAECARRSELHEMWNEASIPMGPGARSRTRVARGAALLGLVLLQCLACARTQEPIVVRSVQIDREASRFHVIAARGYLPGSLRAHLDGQRIPITVLNRGGLSAPIPLHVSPESGRHVLVVSARFLEGPRVVTRRKALHFVVPSDAPRLASSWPGPGTRNLPRSEWIQLEFASAISDEIIDSVSLACRGRNLEHGLHKVGDHFLILNPKGELPGGALCLIRWVGPIGSERLYFWTARAGPPAELHYERTSGRVTAPFPDDHFTRRALRSPTGRSVALPETKPSSGLDRFVEAVRSEIDGLDGFSPVGPLVLETSQPVDPASIPMTAEESMHPASSIVLLDIDPSSPDFGRRIPFTAEVHANPSGRLEDSASLIVFPSLPLSPGGRYGLIVNRAVRVDAQRPLEPSTYMSQLLAPRTSDDSLAVRRGRQLIAPLLWVASRITYPPIPRDDIALALCFSVRSLEGLPDDLLQIRDRTQERPSPRFEIREVLRDTTPGSAIAATVHGIWHASSWSEEGVFKRDAGSRPVSQGTTPIPFTLALPRDAPPDGAPLVFYQHGNPGSAAVEVPVEANRSLAEAGFAVIGFTDVFNRSLRGGLEGDPAVISQLGSILMRLMRHGRIPDYWLQTSAEQIEFLRLLPALADLDLLPFGVPDGVPDLDLSAALGYLGVSEGANHGMALLPLAPEIDAAVLVAGGAPIARMLMYQLEGTSIEAIALSLIGGDAVDLRIAMSLFQSAVDRQDPFNFARFIYRDPLSVQGSLRTASLLMIGGVGDDRVPNSTSEGAAWSMGPIPLLEPISLDVPFLERRSGPLQSNIDAHTTAAYYQIAPVGIPGVKATPGCTDLARFEVMASEGHFCAQIAEESVRARREFFESALVDRPPVIADPAQ